MDTKDSSNTMDSKGLRNIKEGKKRVSINKDVVDDRRRDRSESFYSTETGSRLF